MCVCLSGCGPAGAVGSVFAALAGILLWVESRVQLRLLRLKRSVARGQAAHTSTI